MRLIPPSRSVRAVLHLLNLVPAPGGEWVLAAGALAHGLLSPARCRRALVWSARQAASERRPWTLACMLLAERGRYFATIIRLGARDLEGFRRRLVLEGREHLDLVYGRRGALLLDCRLAGSTAPMTLILSGYRAVFTARGQESLWHDLWRHEPARHSVPVTVPPEDLILWSGLMSRVAALSRIQRALLAGRVVYLTADGEGREAFRVPLPGRDYVVRAGWLAARRSTAVPTLPVLTHREGNRLVMKIHPALPPPLADLDQDIAACRAHLAPIFSEFVRRFPEQCFPLALARSVHASA